METEARGQAAGTEREVETEREKMHSSNRQQPKHHPGRFLVRPWLFSKLGLGKIPLAPPPDEEETMLPFPDSDL